MPVTTNPARASGIIFALGLIGAKTCLFLLSGRINCSGGPPDIAGNSDLQTQKGIYP